MKPCGRPRNSWVRTVTNDLANSYTGLPEAREAGPGLVVVHAHIGLDHCNGFLVYVTVPKTKIITIVIFYIIIIIMYNLDKFLKTKWHATFRQV